MPVAQIYLWKGISDDIIKKVIVGITKVFVDLGIPKHAVEILIHEFPKAHWGIEGLPATESRPDVNPPQ